MLRKVLEGLSVDTWERLRDARTFEIRFGEETITDLLLLDLKRKAFKTTSIVQTSKYEEKNTGTDWEWWLGHPGKWLRLAIQAKKLKRKDRYDSLGHKVSKKHQVDLLEEYAEANNAVPMYCLYNHLEKSPTATSWQCCASLDTYQLACTLTSSAVIQDALKVRGRCNFEWIHEQPQSLPWRCVTCTRLRLRMMWGVGKTPDGAQSVVATDVKRGIYDQLPPEVQASRFSGDIKFSGEYYRGSENQRPRRVLVTDFPDEPSGESSHGFGD
jgi:hypothetical protein